MPRRTNLFSQVVKELKKPLLVAKPTKPSHLLRNLIVLAMVAAAVVAVVMLMKKKKSHTPDTPTPPAPTPPAPTPGTTPGTTTDTLGVNDRLSSGENLISKNEEYKLRMQGDGNLVLSGPDGKAIWASATNDLQVSFYGSKSPSSPAKAAAAAATQATLQSDGNFVIYRGGANKNGKAVWASNTKDGVNLTLQDTGILALTRKDGTTTWSTAGNGPYYSKLYSSPNCGDDKTLNSNLRQGAGGHTVPVCAKPSTRDVAITQVASVQDAAGGCTALNTDGVTGWTPMMRVGFNDPTPLKADLNQHAGGPTTRLCYRQVQPGQAHVPASGLFINKGLRTCPVGKINVNPTLRPIMADTRYLRGGGSHHHTDYTFCAED